MRYTSGVSSISPGGSPQKRINKEYKDLFSTFSLKNRVLKLRFLAFSEGPGRFRELREAGRNHFHLSWYLLLPGVTSYDQKRSAAKMFRSYIKYSGSQTQVERLNLGYWRV